MVRAMCCVGLALLAASIGGCVSPAEFKKSNERIASLEKEIGGMRDSVTAAAESAKKVEADSATLRESIDGRLGTVQGSVDERLGVMRNSVDERLAAIRTSLDERLAAIAKQIAKAEADAAAASNQLPALKNEITRFDELLKQKSAAIGEVEKIVVRNLENACQIYKTQYEALEEALRDLKKRTRPEGEPAPK